MEAGVPDDAGPDGAQCGAGRVDRPVVADAVAGIDVPRVARELQRRLFAYCQLHASTSKGQFIAGAVILGRPGQDHRRAAARAPRAMRRH